MRTQVATERVDPNTLLAALVERVEVEGAALLEPLRTYDCAHGGDLVRTLRVYFEGGCNASQTAERLYLHRSGLLYRLRRIEQLFGFRLDTFPERVALEVSILVANGLEDQGATRPHGSRVEES